MLLNRIMGVFRLSAATFEEIEHDESATGQAALIVLVVAFVTGLGSALFAAFTDSSSLGGFVSALIWAFLGWFIWSLISYFVGTTLFGGQATVGEMLRVIGFAYAPQVLSIIPCVGALIGAIWSLIAGYIAIRQGLDVDDLRAFLTIVIGFVVYIIGSVIVNALIGATGLFF